MQGKEKVGYVIRHFNLLNAELNPICHLLALLGALHILHVSGIMDSEPENPLRFFTSSHKSLLFSASGTESTSCY
jgi:hypothetical protein